jgi:2,3,4,5-tetrahydropyridine-2,6-dicarboxylate N-succinyltransferase
MLDQDLPRQVEDLFSQGDKADALTARAAFIRLRDALGEGTIRAAEPDATQPTGWRVNPWVKKGILLGFRFGRLVDHSLDHGRWAFFDKDTLPLKTIALDRHVRLVPGGSAIREGAFVGRGVICMPPMYINVGAYVGECTLIDSHALIGSCAQIGAKVHISAGAQIGGVIEPVGALPVIIEDDVLVGGNTGIYEGAVVKKEAVIGAGTIITGSTPLYDLPNGTVIKPSSDTPLVVPERAVVVPGARAVSVGAGVDWKLSLATPVIVKYRDERTDTRAELECWIR